MRRIAFLITGLTIALLFPRPTAAACQPMDNTDEAEAQCRADNKYPRRNYSLTIAGTAQCTNSPGNGTYAVCCGEKTEANSVDSVRAPLCGSSEERGKANSTCWQCESDMRCDGADFALGESDDFMFIYRQSIDGSPTDNVWRVPEDKIPAQFTYNGMRYDKNGGLVVCKANNLACGADPAKTYCQNIKHPEIDNRGNSGKPQQQCTEIKTKNPENDTDIRMGARGTPTAVDVAKALIDVGGPTDPKAPQLSTLFGSSNTNPTITGLYQVNLNDGKTPIPKDEKSNWGATLVELATSPGGAILAPVSGYDIGGGYNYTVLYASPTELTLKATREDNVVYGYTLHFADLNVNATLLEAYRKNEPNRTSQLVAIPCGFPIGTTPQNAKFKVAVADTGTFMDPRVRKDWWNTPTHTCANNKPGLVTPLTTRICSARAAAQATGVGRVAGAVDFCRGCTDKQGWVSRLLPKQLIELEGEVHPSGGKLQVPDLSFYVQWLGRAYPYLSPLQIQKNETPIGSTFTVTSTANVSAESDEPKNTCYQQKHGVVTTEFPFLNNLLEYALKLDALLGPFGKQDNFHFDQRYSNQVLTDRDTRGCPEQTAGTSVAAASQTSRLANVFSDIPEPLKPVLLAAVRIADTWRLVSAGGKCKPGDPGCATGGGYGAQVYVHTLTPYGDREIPDHIGVTKEGKSTGFTRGYLPYQSRKTFAAAVIDNAFDHPGLFNPVPVTIPVPFAGIAGALQSLDDMRCSLTPLSKQTPDMHCNDAINQSSASVFVTQPVYRASLDVTTPADPASGDCRQANDTCTPTMSQPAFPDRSCSYSLGSIGGSGALKKTIGDVADYFGVPPAVIAGVLWVENRGSVFAYDNQTVEARQAPGAIDKQTCRPNTCGAVGPMQLSAKPGFNAATCEAGNRAKDNYQVWCGWRTGANDVRGETAYQPNPSNILDALAAAAKKMKSDSGTAGCGRWSRETVHRVITNYFGTPACTRPYPSLYALFQNTIKGQAHTYANTQTNALTYCEFVWGYYQTH